MALLRSARYPIIFAEKPTVPHTAHRYTRRTLGSHPTVPTLLPCSTFRRVHVRTRGNDFVNIDPINWKQFQAPGNNEYLPIADPREWHLCYILDLVNSHFDQLRDAVVDIALEGDYGVQVAMCFARPAANNPYIKDAQSRILLAGTVGRTRLRQR